MKEYTNLLLSFDETITSCPIMTTALLQDACTAGYSIFCCTRRNHNELFGWLDMFNACELFSGFLSMTDTLSETLAANRLSASDTMMLCDRDTDILIARSAGLRSCLFDPKHLYDDFEHELRTDSFAALRELLGI